MRKKMIAFIIIVFIESLGLAMFSLSYSKSSAESIALSILIPEDLVVTTNNEICFTSKDGSEKTIPIGSKITPDYIFPDSVSFSYGEDIHISGEWGDFIEQEALKELGKNAIEEQTSQREKAIVRGICICIVAGLCWLLLGITVSYALIKREKIVLLIVIHAIVILSVSFLLVGSQRYLVHWQI